MRAVLLSGLMILIVFKAWAQTEVDERAVFRFDKGLGFQAQDTSFGLNMRFNIYAWLSYSGMNKFFNFTL